MSSRLYGAVFSPTAEASFPTERTCSLSKRPFKGNKRPFKGKEALLTLAGESEAVSDALLGHNGSGHKGCR
jgi:hypothetical protein